MTTEYPYETAMTEQNANTCFLAQGGPCALEAAPRDMEVIPAPWKLNLGRFQPLVLVAKAGRLPVPLKGESIALSRYESVTDPNGFVLVAWASLERQFHARKALIKIWRDATGWEGEENRESSDKILTCRRELSRRVACLERDMQTQTRRLEALAAQIAFDLERE